MFGHLLLICRVLYINRVYDLLCGFAAMCRAKSVDCIIVIHCFSLVQNLDPKPSKLPCAQPSRYFIFRQTIGIPILQGFLPSVLLNLRANHQITNHSQPWVVALIFTFSASVHYKYTKSLFPLSFDLFIAFK